MTTKQFSIVYFTLAGLLIFGGLGWEYHAHQPCMKLYGVGSVQDSVEEFISCENNNVSNAFLFQFAEIVLLGIVMISLCIVDSIGDWWRMRLWEAVRWSKRKKDKP